MKARTLSDSDLQAALVDLNERGYAVIEQVLDPPTVEHLHSWLTSVNGSGRSPTTPTTARAYPTGRRFASSCRTVTTSARKS